jgi:capsid protein
MWAKADLFGFGKALDSAKISTEEVAAALAWIPAGRPWLDRTNEMSGHIMAIASGIESIPEVCAMYGKDAYQIADTQAAYLKKAGAPLFYAQGGQMAVQAIMAAMGDSRKPEDNTPAQPKEDGNE